MQSPSRQPGVLPSKIDPALRDHSESREPQPLLSLLTSQHPLLSTAINGSLSAYTSSKSYSPRFRYGAEFVERHIGSPVVSTVGTAGRISGVETGVRWWLQRSDSSGTQDGSNKRRRISDEDRYQADVERGLQRVSLQSHGQQNPSDIFYDESLPPYDDQRSPSYEEHSSVVSSPRHDPHSPHNRNWQTRLMMSTSGLGVAMSEESLRSLKYCLSCLRWANGHLGKVLSSLQSVLEEWNQSSIASSSDDVASSSESERITRTPARDRTVITQHIQALKGDVLQTLKNVVDVVSRYAGGALPENARILVRKHLTSLPQRFRLASISSTSNDGGADSEKQSTSDTVTNAQKVMLLAKEGLDMMSQVSGVVNGTIVSAEEWCDRLGKRKERDRGQGREQYDEKRVSSADREAIKGVDQDSKMTNSDEKNTG